MIKRALELGASSLILVHNHPSGDPTPSNSDIAVTRDIIKAADPLGIKVHDHVIIGHGRHASLRDLGLISPKRRSHQRLSTPSDAPGSVTHDEKPMV